MWLAVENGPVYVNGLVRVHKGHGHPYMAVCRAGPGRICWGRQSRRAGCDAPRKRAGNDRNVADDIFTEVDEEIRAERIRALARRYLVVAGVVVAGICIGAGDGSIPSPARTGRMRRSRRRISPPWPMPRVRRTRRLPA
ncbi:hypothetical protein RAA17_17510 [Komagataeibacter rhaeticus]|nr:hypothetical protein [Komagataeibacter rhaeticus]